MQACRTAVFAVITIAAAACGGSAAQQPPPDVPDEELGGGGPTAPPPTTSNGAIDAQAVCAAIDQRRAEGCPFVQDFDLSGDACVSDVAGSIRDPLAVAAASCFTETSTCDGAWRCINAVNGVSEVGFRQCDDTGFGAIAYPVAEWKQRRGALTTRLDELVTTREAPVEVCMVAGELLWLTTVTCADGSKPFASQGAAHAARVGNAGPGGSCGSTIDLYEVKCPEKTYEVFMDMYYCPQA